MFHVKHRCCGNHLEADFGMALTAEHPSTLIDPPTIKPQM
jgi:hypothetical protein